jgi:hypothetical protein
MRQKLQAGAPEALLSLQMRAQQKRTVEFFSSNPRLVYPPGMKKERLIKVLQPGDISTINMAVKVTSGGLADTKQQVLKARLHCVDVTTKELVYAWLFEIDVDKPMVQRAY